MWIFLVSQVIDGISESSWNSNIDNQGQLLANIVFEETVSSFLLSLLGISESQVKVTAVSGAKSRMLHTIDESFPSNDRRLHSANREQLMRPV